MNFVSERFPPKAIRLIGEDGKLYNIVDLLGGGDVAAEAKYDVNRYPAKSIRLVGDDGNLYNLVDLLMAGGTGGESAYEIAVRHGFEGTEEAWLASLKGPKGDKGEAFTFDDFTPEQLDSLKGPQGDPGKDAEPQFTPEQVEALLALIDGDA